MDILFYNLSKRENSTLRPSGAGDSRSVFLKEGTSIFNPTFIMADDVTEYNYCQWGPRYYYIRDIVVAHNQRFEVVCSLDVMATYKEGIGNVRAYCLYATSGYNAMLTDQRLSNQATAIVARSTAQLFGDIASTPIAGTFCLQYATSNATYGPAGCVHIGFQSARGVVSILSANGFNEWLDNLAKQFQGAYDSIISCTYLPFTWANSDAGAGNIILGGYDTGVAGYRPQSHYDYTCNISIPWQWSDFRNSQPYTSLIIHLPGAGLVELNPNDFIGQNSIEINASVDGITGTCVIYVGSVARVNASFGVPVAIGTTGTSPLSGLSSVVSGVGAGAMLGGPVGALAGAGAGAFLGYIQSSQRNVGSIGSSAGNASLFAGPSGVTYGTVELYLIGHNTSDEPADMATSHGRPVMAVQGPVSGYNQFNDASVNCNAPDEIKSRINSMLNGGFFYE